ncbi:camp specific phosphodiesterase, putative [Leishmania tarentolae]|uniref:Camp specific phosphodiesterase, putative n=1 Tax=Leishmania tarentolae TaxID=5689 RepID=A0A640KDR9_LEITA|nr:camp specific phosphodiesterase, putative [Leishmania tarentolae]
MKEVAHNVPKELASYKVDEADLPTRQLVVLRPVKHRQYLYTLLLLHVTLAVELLRHSYRPHTRRLERFRYIRHVTSLDQRFHHHAAGLLMVDVIALPCHFIEHLQQVSMTSHIGGQHTVDQRAVRVRDVLPTQTLEHIRGGVRQNLDGEAAVVHLQHGVVPACAGKDTQRRVRLQVEAVVHAHVVKVVHQRSHEQYVALQLRQKL